MSPPSCIKHCALSCERGVEPAYLANDGPIGIGDAHKRKESQINNR